MTGAGAAERPPTRRENTMKAIRLPLVLLLTMAALSATPDALADPAHATSYYVSLGASLAQGFQPTFDVDHGYADQLYALLLARSPKLEHVCAWTRMCAPPPLGPDIHPNTAGYGVIAQAFADVVGGVAP
jgi:hypothetical protein